MLCNFLATECVVSRAGGSGGVALKGACATNMSTLKVFCISAVFVKISTDTVDQTMHHPDTVLDDFTVTTYSLFFIN